MYVFGWAEILMIAVPILILSSALGGWLFFVQHQFEGTHWEEGDSWDFQVAAIYGSSYYVLPPVLQWFTGNIGLHHIHHLCSMIPNYKLQACLDASPRAQVSQPADADGKPDVRPPDAVGRSQSPPDRLPRVPRAAAGLIEV